MVCLDPDMEKAPEGTWSCPHCVRTLFLIFSGIICLGQLSRHVNFETKNTVSNNYPKFILFQLGLPWFSTRTVINKLVCSVLDKVGFLDLRILTPGQFVDINNPVTDWTKMIYATY